MIMESRDVPKAMELEQFLETIILALVEKPEAVKISRTTDDMGVLISVLVDASDMGRVIGREGATAKALRVIMRTYGMKQNARVSIKIEEPEGGKSYQTKHSSSYEEESNALRDIAA